jgi:hypothetical protein
LGEEPFENSEGEVKEERAVTGQELAVLAEKYLLPPDWIWVLAGGGLE